MKLLRVGQKGKEKPAILDKDGKIRDISSHIKDLNSDHLNFNTISKLQSVDLSSLPELSSGERIGSCITKPGKFVAIGLNFSDHAAESGLPVPSELRSCFPFLQLDPGNSQHVFVLSFDSLTLRLNSAGHLHTLDWRQLLSRDIRPLFRYLSSEKSFFLQNKFLHLMVGQVTQSYEGMWIYPILKVLVKLQGLLFLFQY